MSPKAASLPPKKKNKNKQVHYQEGLKQWRQTWPQCCRKAKALFPFRLLNSDSEILSNPEPTAANREAAGPLNCPAEEAACLQDLGLPRNQPFSRHLAAGWGLGGAADSSPGTHPATAAAAATKAAGEGPPFRGMEDGCSPAQGVAAGQDGVRTPAREVGAAGVENPRSGPNRNDATAQAQS